MRILVTGATGFLGKNLCLKLTSRGHSVYPVHSKNCDLTHQDSLDQFNDISFDRIYHLAAWTQAGDFCLHHPGEQWLINQKINTHVLDWWVQRQPSAKLIAIGTSCGYDPDFPLMEKDYLYGKPIESLFTYAMTKRMLLSGLIALQKQFGLHYLYLIPSTLYGPGYHTDGRQLHFIFDLIRKILNGYFHHEPVVLWGDGTQKRELFHIDDFVSATLLLDETEENTWVNIGSGQEHSIIEFAKKICGIVGYPFEKILFDSTKYVGAKSKVLSIEKLKKSLPKFEMMSLDQGLEETVKWFRDAFFPDRHKQGQYEPKYMCGKVPG